MPFSILRLADSSQALEACRELVSSILRELVSLRNQVATTLCKVAAVEEDTALVGKIHDCKVIAGVVATVRSLADHKLEDVVDFKLQAFAK